MRQPELGHKLVQLRKEKNLTQEELVDACNVSIRTIQRIESGEVTPRISTIKIILAALDEDMEAFKSSGEGVLEPEKLVNTSKWLNMAFVSGIIYLILGFPEALLEMSRFGMEQWSFFDPWRPSALMLSVYVTVKTFSYGTFCLFMIGFLKLGETFGNSLLKVAVYLMLGVASILAFIDIFSIVFGWDEDQVLPMLTSGLAATGGVGIVFGLGLIKLQSKMGSLSLASGVMELIIGGLFLTVILSFLAVMLTIPATIVEITLLYRASEQIKRQLRAQ